MFKPDTPSYFDHHPNAYRIIVGVLFMALSILAGLKSYRFASSPTDENVFTNPPSEIFFKEYIPAQPIFGKKTTVAVNDGIRYGDILFEINGKSAYSEETLKKVLSSFASGDSITASIIRNPGRFKRQYRTTKSDVESSLKTLPTGAYVIEVTENGASDRAGMKEGDLIVKINGRAFKTVAQADVIMRSAQADKAIEYEVLRAGKPLKLDVVLARFGIKFAQVAFFLCGIGFMFTGLFLGIRQPREKAIRLLSMAFILMGYGFASLWNRPVFMPSILERLFNISPGILLLFGVAAWIHAGSYFPKTNRERIAKRWIIILPYCIAIGTIFLIFLFDNGGFFINGVIAMMIFNTIVYFQYRKTHDSETKKIHKLINRIGVFTFIGSIVLNILVNSRIISDSVGFVVPLVMLGIPFGYLYVIGRYRLFNIDIRLRRNIQYTAISLLWTAFLLFAVVRLIVFIIHAEFAIPNFRLTAASFELLDTSLGFQERNIAEKAIVTILAIIIVLGSIWVGRRGQKFINRRYFRNQYDYKKAAREISDVTANTVQIPALARGVVEKIAEIIHVKQAAILIFKSADDILCGESFGVPEDSFKKMVRLLDRKVLKTLTEFRTDSRFSVENLPENIKNAFKELNFRHLVPLYAKNKLTGALIIGEKLSESPFHTEDFSFLKAVSNQISIAIENAFLYEDLAGQERLKHELEIARRIQLESLPQTTPDISGFDISGISKPALEVGGDYFDYLVNSPECITIVVGDVSGKGTSAALYMSKVQGMIRSLHEFTVSSPRDLLNHANQLLYSDIEKRSYITALGARFDSAQKCVTVSRAGHLPLYYFCGETKCFKEIMPKGIGLSLSSNTLFTKFLEEVQCPFKSGDIFLMLTDGITEAQNLLKEEFGAERVEKIITENTFLKAEEIRDRIITEVEAFAGEAEQHDDCTVIVVKVV